MKIRIFEVGGAVRDKLLGLKPKDIDYAVEAPSWEAMREYILSKGGNIFLETPKYFTMRALLPGIGAADFVLCRKDGQYKDGRHPENVEVGTILDDLARRDFTINAMARDVETTELFDPHGGRFDLQRKQIYFVGEPNDRLEEDKLRAFRAVRFAITKGFTIPKYTYDAIIKLGPNAFDSVSTERIREELLRMFKHDSYDSFRHLFDKFPNLGDVAIRRGVWLKPTLEAK